MTITMYGADWCGDCIRAKAVFKRRDVSYVYVNLEETPDATEIVLERNNGVQKIPVIVFPDNTHLTEPSDAKLEAKLDQLDAASTTVGEQTFEVVEQTELGRFELHRDGELVGFASYQPQNGSVVIPHVETLYQHRGQGYAGRLMEGVLDILEADGRSLVPVCPFAVGHVRDNPRPAVAGAA